MVLTDRRKMERIKEIVRIIYNIDNVDINSFEYKFIETLRETCDGSQESIERLVNLTSKMEYLASLKNNEHVTRVFQNVCHMLLTIYGDVGLPKDIEDLFYFPLETPKRLRIDMINKISYCFRRGYVGSNTWKYCKLSKLKGIGERIICNIVCFYKHGTLPEIAAGGSIDIYYARQVIN
tara:strand:- start:1249 stop:1785 length:537 start_codon:yes stop_codon:yes gene_type:complete